MISRKKSSSSGTAAAHRPDGDRISQLPDGIIHSILYRINSPRTAASTSALSRRWLHLWRSYPAVEFRYWEIDPNFTNKFQSFAAAASRRLRELIFLDSFRIRIQTPSHNDKAALEELLAAACPADDDDGSSRSPLAIEVLITESLSLGSSAYRLPDGTFSNCRRTKSLRLAGCGMSHYRTNCTIRLDSLRDLCLADCRISGQVLQSWLANAPNLDKLTLKCIREIGSLDLSHPHLAILHIEGNCCGLQLQLTSAPLLQTFRLRDAHNLKVAASSSFSAPNLKLIEIEDVSAYDESQLYDLGDLISRSPSVECLVFHQGFRYRYGKSHPPPRWPRKNKCWVSSKLRILSSTSYTRLKKPFEIDAPNLVSLCIATDSPVNDVINVVNVASNCQCVVDWRIDEYKLHTNWFPDLRSCLATLTQFPNHPVLKLHFPLRGPAKVSVFDPDQLECTSSTLLEVQHLRFGWEFSAYEYTNDARDISLLLEGVLRTCHPKTISTIQHSSSSPDLQNIFKQIKEIKQENCCRNVKCWRHRLEDVEIESVAPDVKSTIRSHDFSLTLIM